MSFRDPYEDYFPYQWAKKFAQEANEKGMFINIGRIWLSPYEFEDFASKHRMSLAENYLEFRLDEIKLKDPRPIIPRMEKEIEKKIKEMTDRKDEFEKKVREYYKY